MRVRYPLPLPELILAAVDALTAKNAPSNKSPISTHIEASYGHVVKINSTLLGVHLKAMLNTGKLVLVNNNYMRPPPPPPSPPIPSPYSSDDDDVSTSHNSKTSSSTSTSSSKAATDSKANPIANENVSSTENESFHLLNADDKAIEIKGIQTMTVNILESSKDYVLLCDVPGLTKADVQVTVEDAKTLVIQSIGDRKRKREEEGYKYIRLEKEVSPKFKRKFLLPTDSNLAAISAKCENGLLTVSVEKLPPQPQAKTFDVNIS